MVGINDDFADKFVAGHINLQRAGEGVASRIIKKILIPLRTELAEKLRVADLAGVTGSEQVRRWKDLQERVNEAIASAYNEAKTSLQGELVELAEIAQDQTLKISNEVIGSDIFRAVLTKQDLKALVSPKTQLIHGNPAADWWAKQSKDLQHRFKQQINIGMAAGETNDQLVQRIRGKQIGYRMVTIKGRKKQIPAFSGGIMDISTREAKTLVRTAVAQVSNQVNWETWLGNSELLRGVQALVTLDNKTTVLCMSRSGGAWDFDGDPLPQSKTKIQFPGIPPWHFNCRTILIPVTKSWEDLIKEAGGKSKKLLDTVPDSTQSSMNGQVAGDLNYEQWLKNQPVEFQQEVLGMGKWNLWQKGKITMAQMVDQSGNQLTLSQLRARSRKQ